MRGLLFALAAVAAATFFVPQVQASDCNGQCNQAVVLQSSVHYAPQFERIVTYAPVQQVQQVEYVQRVQRVQRVQHVQRQQVVRVEKVVVENQREGLIQRLRNRDRGRNVQRVKTIERVQVGY